MCFWIYFAALSVYVNTFHIVCYGTLLKGVYMMSFISAWFPLRYFQIKKEVNFSEASPFRQIICTELSVGYQPIQAYIHLYNYNVINNWNSLFFTTFWLNSMQIDEFSYIWMVWSIRYDTIWMIWFNMILMLWFDIIETIWFDMIWMIWYDLIWFVIFHIHSEVHKIDVRWHALLRVSHHETRWENVVLHNEISR